MIDINALVAQAKAGGGSDIHIIGGLPPKYRVSGSLENMSETPVTDEECAAMAKLEPTLLCVLAVIVGFIVIAIYGSMFGMYALM